MQYSHYWFLPFLVPLLDFPKVDYLPRSVRLFDAQKGTISLSLTNGHPTIRCLRIRDNIGSRSVHLAIRSVLTGEWTRFSVIRMISPGIGILGGTSGRGRRLNLFLFLVYTLFCSCNP